MSRLVDQSRLLLFAESTSSRGSDLFFPRCDIILSMTIIQELRALSSDPQAQAEYAVSLLKPEQRLDAILASLKALCELPTPEARQPLLQFYDHFASNGTKRDPGAHIRRAILDALRPIALLDDIPLLVDAITTFEFLPPKFAEDAGMLRSGALLILNDLDDLLPGYYAVRLLVDGYTEEMSGEPALTAVRVLESQDQMLPLYQFALSNNNPKMADVVSECLRSLRGMPEELIPSLIERFDQSNDGAILVGLYELLVNHHEGPQGLDFLASSLLAQQDLDLFRFLVITLLSSGKPVLISLVSNMIRLETNRQRIEIIIEAADLFASNPDVSDIANTLRVDPT